jgi:hypothetical protein
MAPVSEHTLCKPVEPAGDFAMESCFELLAAARRDFRQNLSD